MKVQVVNKSNHRLPEYSHPGDAGMDLKANINVPVTLKPGSRTLIPTGLHTLLPEGHVLYICSRSGLALKEGIFVLNAPGVVDKNYTGDIGVVVANFSDTPFIIHPGDRIAQAILMKYETIDWNEVATLDTTERGENGFGSTKI